MVVAKLIDFIERKKNQKVDHEIAGYIQILKDHDVSSSMLQQKGAMTLTECTLELAQFGSFD